MIHIFVGRTGHRNICNIAVEVIGRISGQRDRYVMIVHSCNRALGYTRGKAGNRPIRRSNRAGKLSVRQCCRNNFAVFRAFRNNAVIADRERFRIDYSGNTDRIRCETGAV